ncbi:MAG TPA: TolC family protein, partial [Bacteroidales bacterium]|nr:TolC family protein [Bacteroidales bacterium]
MKIKLRMTLLGSLFISFFLFCSIEAKSQNDTLFITLQQAVDRAIEQNLMQQVSALEIERKQVKVQEYMAALYPTIQGNGSYTRNIKKPVIFMPPESPFGPTLEIGSDNAYNGSLSFSLPLFAMNIYESIKLGKKDVEMSTEKERENRINLAATVRNTYYNVLLLQQTVEVYQRSYQNATENLKNIQQMQANGLVSEYDAIRAKVQVDNLYPNLLQAENMHENLMNIFKIILNIETTTPITLDENELIKVQLEELDTIPSNWYNDNPTLRQFGINRQLLDIQKKMIRNSSIPTLAAFGNYTYQTQANDFKFSDYQWIASSAVGLQLNIPIFKGFSVRRQLSQAEIGLRQLDLQEAYTRNNLEAQIQNAKNAIYTAIKKVNAASGNVELSQKGYKIAQTRYNTGQATLVELNDAENAMMQARLNLIQARSEYLN